MQREQLLAHFSEHISLAYTCSKPITLSPTYDLQVSIPKGRRFFLWLTDFNQPTWYLLEPGKYGDIGTVYSFPTSNDHNITCLLGSIVSGYLVDIAVNNKVDDGERPPSPDVEHPKAPSSAPIFVVDDIYQYDHQLLVHTSGDTVVRLPDSVKAKYLHQYMDNIHTRYRANEHLLPFGFYGIYVASMASITSSNTSTCSYPIKNTQYRSTTEILPHYNGADVNCPVSLVSEVSDNVRRIFHAFNQSSKPRYMHFTKPVYRNNRCVFLVQACEMSDIYKLYCRCLSNDKMANDTKQYQQMSFVFYQYALVPDYHTSVLLNTLFRDVPANQNLDVIEESDDESDENTAKKQRTSSGQLIPENKNLERTLFIECAFDWLRKQWIPHTLVVSSINCQVPLVHEL